MPSLRDPVSRWGEGPGRRNMELQEQLYGRQCVCGHKLRYHLQAGCVYGDETRAPTGGPDYDPNPCACARSIVELAYEAGFDDGYSRAVFERGVLDMEDGGL